MKGSWQERWCQRIRDKFPECLVIMRYDMDFMGFDVGIGWPKDKPLWCFGDKTGGVLLNGSRSPACRQNRKSFRDEFDKNLRKAIDGTG